MDVIPLPLEASVSSGGSRLPVCAGAGLDLVCEQSELRPLAAWMAAWIAKRWGLACRTACAEAGAGGGGPAGLGGGGVPAAGRPLLRLAHLRVDPGPSQLPLELGESVEAEAYALDLRPDAAGEIVVSAATVAAVCRGAATLLQLLRPSSGADDALPASLRVRDAPAWRWRGVLLDSGRHFYPASFVKRVVDVMALLKMNTLHWHLTEDQGWRIEVKGWPLLTEVGAWRGEPPMRAGGYYTQDEIRDVVAHAASLGVRVVPEIELPGHCGAALAAYPWLSCTGRVEPRVPTQWGIHEDVYCPGKDEVLDFLESVLTEVASLFPCEYFHIGGDECPKTRWRACAACQARIRSEGLGGEEQLQGWLMQRAARHLAGLGKRVVGWDEMLEGGLPEGAAVMSWRGIQGGLAAARAGHDVVMTPTSHCYFDYRQGDGPNEPGAYYARLPLEVVYSFDPLPPCCSASAGAAAAAIANGGGRAGDGRSGSGASSGSGSGSWELMEGEGGTGGEQPQALAGAQQQEPGEQGGEQQQQQQQQLQRQQQQQQLQRQQQHRQQQQGQQQQRQQRPCGCGAAPIDRARILGGQANLWTEYVPDEATAEYLLLPRLAAMAEALWSPPEPRDWRDFRRRLEGHVEALQALGYRPRPLDGRE
ncbi:beta-N-acetylhexosaminidase [Raphidocelis subcapitata]|uniref:Beta-hexosaminidase n=1 Tax=Raphidocelis subcapitata TaxID=307507 RepID=A0A2V0P961_9CHLO|nr:beta-N-acetylhexosaminidase [Raphidocelis subcapitata]|eukprot:GBF95482.1 beta-N-acetylhexosaminidase [Raphidocelis subcapitata]